MQPALFVCTFSISVILTTAPSCSLCITNTASNSRTHVAGFYNAPQGLLCCTFMAILLGCCTRTRWCPVTVEQVIKNQSRTTKTAILKTVKFIVENYLSHAGSEMTTLLVIISPPKHLIRKWVF